MNDSAGMTEKQYVVHRIEKEAKDGNVYLASVGPDCWRWEDEVSITFETRDVAKNIAAAWNARPQSIDLAFFTEVES